MKRFKPDILYLISGLYILITGVFNLYGYFHLPEEVATQFGLPGGNVNYMSKGTYLITSFLIVAVLAYFSVRTEKEKRLKYMVINTVIVIANILMITTQL
ncbi:MAG: hypothetical protein WBI07_19065 [Mobilitalea sp.]